MRSIVKVLIGNDKYYLSSVYPIKWSQFISEAKGYQDEDEARMQLNFKFGRISDSLHNDYNNIKNIIIDTYEGEVLISSHTYLNMEG